MSDLLTSFCHEVDLELLRAVVIYVAGMSNGTVGMAKKRRGLESEYEANLWLKVEKSSDMSCCPSSAPRC